MTHIAGHSSVIDKLAHTFGIAKPHDQTTPTNTANTTDATQKSPLQKGDNLNIENKSATSELKTAKPILFAHSHSQPVDASKAYSEWKPFKSVQTGAAVGAMSGFPFGLTAGFASAVAVGKLSKDYKMALAVGASVFVTSVAAGAVGGAVGYKTRSMNIDTTEPPMGTMFDSPAQAKKNMEVADKKWAEIKNSHVLVGQ